MDYGFENSGKVYTPNGTPAITPADNVSRNAEIESAELARWQTSPDYQIGYFAGTGSGSAVTLWPGTQIGTVVYSNVYRHNFGGKFVSMCVRGTNGSLYYGRASCDWGQCINLRKSRA